MGSQVIEALVQQIGSIKVNSEELSPSTSRPIEQLANPFQSSSDNIIEQILKLATAKDGGTEFSRPIEQVKGDKFEAGANDADNAIIEQKTTGTEGSLLRPGPYQGPIEQLEFKTASGSTKPVQQFITRRDTSADGTPIEQQDTPQNSINIEQFNFIQLIFPPCGSVKNPVDTNLLWRIRDFGFPFDVSTLIFIVNGAQVQDTSFFTITPIANGLQFDYNPPVDFGFSEEVELFVQISDTDVPPNTFFVRCFFTTVPDTRPPQVLNLSPACDSTNVSVTAPVEFDVVDSGLGVDQDKIIFSIEGIPVCDGLTFTSTTISGSGTGFHVRWDHEDDPFRFDSEVTVAIQATDLSANENASIFICCFSTESSVAPLFLSFVPEPCDSFRDNTTGLNFEVFGVEDGVDISTLEVRVDSTLRSVVVRPRLRRSQ